MEFVRLLLVFLHLLGMGMLIAMFFVQRRTDADAPLNKGWLHGSALQLLTGVALMGLAPLIDQDYDNIKIGVKLLVLVVIAAAGGGQPQQEEARRPGSLPAPAAWSC